jgi:hypothetical protein
LRLQYLINCSKTTKIIDESSGWTGFDYIYLNIGIDSSMGHVSSKGPANAVKSKGPRKDFQMQSIEVHNPLEKLIIPIQQGNADNQTHIPEEKPTSDTIEGLKLIKEEDKNAEVD